MEVEDGVIWVYGVGEDGVQAFTTLESKSWSSWSGSTSKTRDYWGAG